MLEPITKRREMFPKNIIKEHLEKAIEEIDRVGIRKGRHSSTYDLIHNGKSYPPKLVLSIANRYANGSELQSSDFVGGEGTPAFKLLEEAGYKIIQKNDPLKSLIEDYKKRISKTRLEDEIYKWELVNEYRGRPNPEKPDFYQEIKEVKFGNLIYAMGVAVLNRLASERPEELRHIFRNLYNESIDLTKRVKSFNKETLKIYRELGGTLQHHQDERSIATYLTFHNPDKYTFYKSSFYKKYCNLIGVEEAKKNEKYPHYLMLLDELIENYIIPDSELIEEVKTLIPTFYNGTNHKLLAQDILYQMLDKKQETNYWVFQGNPKLFDFETSLREGILTDWVVNAHKDKIKIGDKVILWITGSNSGCYALAEVASEPYPKSSSPDDHLWKVENTSELKVDLKITNNLVENPILKSDIESVDELKELKVGNQGTNFSATEDEYQTLLDLISSNKTSAYESVKNALDSTLVNEFIAVLRDYVKQKNIQPEDDRISFNVRPNKNRLVFIIGSRYAFSIEKVKKRTEISFISKEILTNDAGSFSNHNQEIEAYWNKTTNISGFENNIVEGFDIELSRNYKSPFKRFSNNEFIEDIYQSKIIMGEKKYSSKYSLNTILYGPPGTGKTYNTVIRAAEIIEERKIDTYDEALKIFKANLHGRIEFITFHQNYSYEDFIQGLRPETDDASELLFVKKDGVFKRVVDRAKSNPYYVPNGTRLKDYTVTKSNEDIVELWSTKTNSIRYVPYQLIIDLMDGIISNKISIEDIKKRRDLDLPTILGSKVEKYYFGIESTLYNICEFLIEKREENANMNYVLIIDEINRANISRVFGELITLIEPDKRSDGSIPLQARLPSGDPFIVPSNLYIIGTMNTADKSIALLDIALRRRFEFESMYPMYEIEGQKIYDVDILRKINEQIIKSKGHDFQIGHAYFMGENRDLVQRMNKKVIPLLLEYYMNDEKEVKGILQSAGLSIEENSWPLRITGTID